MKTYPLTIILETYPWLECNIFGHLGFTQDELYDIVLQNLFLNLITYLTMEVDRDGNFLSVFAIVVSEPNDVRGAV